MTAMTERVLYALEPVEVWFVAVCEDCEPRFPQPFKEPAERNAWAAAHATATGHYVGLAVEVRR